MITKIFSVFDDKADLFMPPFYNQQTPVALRVFADACRQDDHPFRQNPADYHLYEVGTFNDETGDLMGLSKPVLLIGAADVLSPLESTVETKIVKSKQNGVNAHG